MKRRNLWLALNDCPSQIPARAEEETRECREQEYKDRFGNCKPCKQCDAGQELSKVGTKHFFNLFCLSWMNRSHNRAQEHFPLRKNYCHLFIWHKESVETQGIHNRPCRGKKKSAHKKKICGLHERNGHHCLEKCILSEGTSIIYNFLFFTQRTAGLLLAFVEHRPFFNQSHPYFWPSAAEWLPLFFPTAPCPTYCLRRLKQTMPKLAALSAENTFFPPA